MCVFGGCDRLQWVKTISFHNLCSGNKEHTHEMQKGEKNIKEEKRKEEMENKNKWERWKEELQDQEGK